MANLGKFGQKVRVSSSIISLSSRVACCKRLCCEDRTNFFQTLLALHCYIIVEKTLHNIRGFS